MTVAPDSPPILCELVYAEDTRGLTGRNTKRKSCASVELEDGYEQKVKSLKSENDGLTHFLRMHDYVHH